MIVQQTAPTLVPKCRSGDCIPMPPEGLAGQAYLDPPSYCQVDLRWCLDESEWLEPPLDRVWGELLSYGAAAFTEIARHYAVDDPYGGLRASETLSQHFRCRLHAQQITFGAGSSSLLHDCAALAARGSILTIDGCHPDLSVWAHSANIPVRWLNRNATLEDWHSAVVSTSPTVIHCDRPSMWGKLFPLEEIRELSQTAPHSIVVIDEAYAPYLTVAESAVRLVPEVGNLLVLRSFSKGYCCGGLRVGYAVAGEAAAHRVRQVVSPLQVSELSFQLALRLLRAGDVFAGLRQRIREIKPRLVAGVSALGTAICVGHPDLPWILMDDTCGSATAWFHSQHIAVKRCEFGWGAECPGKWIRVAVPLSERRVKDCAAILGCADRDDGERAAQGGRTRETE